QSVAETGQLSYEIRSSVRSPFLEEMVNQPTDKKLSVDDLASRTSLVPTSKVGVFQAKLEQLKGTKVYFQAPANTAAGTVADLVKKGKLLTPYPDGTTAPPPFNPHPIAFRAALNCFEVEGGASTIVRHSELAKPSSLGGVKYPAKIYIFAPGA